MSVYDSDSKRGAAPEGEVPPVRLSDTTLVLYVHPGEGDRAVMAEALRRLGATVVTSASAASAIDLFGYVIPTVLVIDVGLLDKHGYWLIKQVRRLEPHRGGRVLAIAITDPTEEMGRLRALATEFDEVCPRPCDAERIGEIIANFRARAEGPRALSES